MKRSISGFRLRALALLLGGTFLATAVHGDDESPSDRDRYKKGLAGNEQVEEIIRNFAGRGEVGDDSEPTPAPQAVEQFEVADGLEIELVAAEPDVMQPLFMHFDDRGRLWVVQYLQYPFPEGLKVIKYDQHLRAVFDKVPQPPPNHVRGKDKITVFEDTDGDGIYDSHKDVITGLNITSSVTTGHGGIWVLNPPYLLFYPDADGDDVPDGDPEVRLSGFGIEDTHSISNSLMWGTDGWLYGANGSTTTGNVSSAVSKNVQWEGQCVWRYHPDTHVFEIFAEGGGNTFSLEIDSKGRVFSGTNHGSTRGMFYPQGSYATKNWGKHGPLTNPFAFGYFQHMRHEGDRDRFAQTFVIYEGGTLPERYHHTVIAANSLHNRVWASELIADTSTYRTVDMPPVVTTPDHWFRPVSVQVGPDGAVYLADWYDTRLTHVDPRDNWHKTSGRIYRLQAADNTHPITPSETNLRAKSDDELIASFGHRNKVIRQTAVRVLGDRLLDADDPNRGEVVERLRTIALDQESDTSLEALWTLHWAGEFDFELAGLLLDHRDEHVRRWTIRLLGDHHRLNDALASQLAGLAKTEPYVQVRSQLASSAQRFDTQHALPIIADLVRRDEDRTDLHMPLLLWWAVEAHCGEGREQVLELFSKEEFWNVPLVQEVILSRLMQRFAMDDVAGEGTPSDGEGLSGLAACARLLEMSPSQDHSQKLMAGFLEAYEGREITNLPDSLATALNEYQKAIGQSDLALSLRLGKKEAIDEALKVVRSESAPVAQRLAYIEILGQVDQPRVVPTLLALLSSKSHGVKRVAMQALMNYDDPKIGATICSRYQSSIPEEHGLRDVAHQVLASRAVWTKQFLTEIENWRIKRDRIPLDIVQQMRLHDDDELQARIDKIWGKTRSTPAEKQQQIARLRDLIAGRTGAGTTADAVHGGELFKKHCATCHTLFGDGGRTGPDLTGYERTNVDFLLLAIVDPSAAIREEFTQFQILTDDGRVIAGLIDNQTPTTVTIRGVNNQTTLISRDEIDVLKATPISIMPDGLTDKMTDQELRDLFAYLMSPTPPATASTGGAE
ncbi:Cytochrome c [Maioricimonas rarisocia]|uniref:Cytochrome c n=1 Tax=Maioricimonas rarisocia TaxID=2528026 RepID=A0A517ZC83_9PLAN|nr:PVC-type heme-binding CxxCH protein [Maioricimonas rarisocia]QDU40050.1 Cytochrome c [Maioricimonas rarisocia]